MTWIAACNGQRGIYQETIMTDEERQQLLLDLRRQSTDDLFGKAADEIKRLARELEEAKASCQRYAETIAGMLMKI